MLSIPPDLSVGCNQRGRVVRGQFSFPKSQAQRSSKSFIVHSCRQNHSIISLSQSLIYCWFFGTTAEPLVWHTQARHNWKISKKRRKRKTECVRERERGGKERQTFAKGEGRERERERESERGNCLEALKTKVTSSKSPGQKEKNSATVSCDVYQEPPPLLSTIPCCPIEEVLLASVNS